MTTEGGGSNRMENSSNHSKIKESLVETNQKVEASLLTSIEEYIQNHSSKGRGSSGSGGEGIDFLHVKNTLLLSYLIDLTVYLKNKLIAKKKNQEKQNDNIKNNNLRRLTEMKVVLDKVRGLDKKLRYQIDKLLQAENASTFATTTTATAAETTAGPNPNAPDDPLQYRPDPKALSMDSSDSDDDDDHSDGEDDSEEEEEDSSEADDDDDDLQAAKQTMALARGESLSRSSKDKKKEKKKSSRRGKDDDGENNNNDGIYRAPRHTAMPYLLDKEDKEAIQEKRKRRQMRTSELALSLRNQYGDTPEQEDYHGGTDYGKQAAAAKKFAAREAARIQFEEDTMQRLTISRKEKKERKRIMRMEGSNLTGIADLGNLVRETNHLIGDDNNDGGKRRKGRDTSASMMGGSGGGTERYSTTGKRKKEAIDRDGRPLAKRKGGKIKNSYQAALFGRGGGDGGGSSKKRKKSKR